MIRKYGVNYISHGLVKGLILWAFLVVPAIAADVHEAAKAADLYKVQALVKANPDAVNLKDGSGRTPLHWAVRNDHLGVVEFLLSSGADIQAVDNLGYTALYYSVWLGRKAEITERLISHGSDVNFNKGGASLLFLASRDGKEEIASMLIANGEKVNDPDSVGKTPLHISAEGKSQNPVELLLNNGASPSTKDKLERTPLHQSSKDLDVYVFSSHAHDDHYDKIILDWENIVGRITCVFGWPNERGKNRVCLSPREKKKTGEIEVLYVNSPEADPLDNAFLVKADGLTIYHGGDYGPLGGIEKITSFYEQDMRFLKENANDLDIMFLASRLINGQVPRYINYSIETAGPRTLFPMHYQSSEFLFRELADEIAKSGYRTKVMPPEDRGDFYIYLGGKK